MVSCSGECSAKPLYIPKAFEENSPNPAPIRCETGRECDHAALLLTQIMHRSIKSLPFITRIIHRLI